MGSLGSKKNVPTAPSSKRLNDLTASTGKRGPFEFVNVKDQINFEDRPMREENML